MIWGDSEVKWGDSEVNGSAREIRTSSAKKVFFCGIRDMVWETRWQ